MIKVIWLTIILAVQVQAQQSYNLPPGELPASYLEKLVPGDTTRQLSEGERRRLIQLFVKSYIVSVREYKQDYSLKPTTPVYQLLKANFPALAEREGEGGIFLEAIVRFFNRMPEYENIVNQALREDLGRKRKCSK